MDFEVTYTPEQEAFRAEIRVWLAENIPVALSVTRDDVGIYIERLAIRATGILRRLEVRNTRSFISAGHASASIQMCTFAAFHM